MGEPFQVIREIGRGATGAVYEVRVPGHEAPMAAKVLEVHTDQSRLRFEREYEVMSRFRHSNVATAHGFGVLSSGAPYLLFDLVRGGTLEDLLEEQGPLIEEDVRALLTPVASGLAHAHSLGTTHRDLKPANILLTRGGTPIVSDFGVAQSLELERLTLTGAVVGTPAYMAPEQQRAIPGVAVGPGSDVYALGVILYEALTGELPYAATDPRLKVPEISPAMGRIVERCLQEDPHKRYPDAGELLRALEVAEGRALGRGWLAAGLASLILIPLLVAGVVLAFADEPGAPAQPAESSTPSPTPEVTPSPSAGPVVRDWSLSAEVGDRWRGRFTRQMDSAVGLQSLAWGVEQEVLERDRTTIRVRAKIVTGRFTQSSGTVVYDSERPELNSPAFRGLGVLIGQEYSYRQDHRTGQVIAVSGGEELMRLLAEQGFGGMNWLSDKNLRRMFTALFGVLPETGVPPGEGWEAHVIKESWAAKCEARERGPAVEIRADYVGVRQGRPFEFKGRYRWQAGRLTAAEAEYDDDDDMVGAAKNIYRWEELPGKD